MPGEGDTNQHTPDDFSPLSGDVQDPGPPASSATNLVRNSAEHSAMAPPTGGDRPVSFMDGAVVETAGGPSSTRRISPAQTSEAHTRDGTDMAAQAGVEYGEREPQGHGQQQEQLPGRARVEPAAAAAAAASAPAQLALEEKGDRPGVEAVGGNGPDSGRESDDVNGEKLGGEGNLQQARSQELHQLEQPRGEEPQQVREQQQEERQQQERVTTGVQVHVRAQMEDSRDQPTEKDQEQERQQQEQGLQERPQPNRTLPPTEQNLGQRPEHPEVSNGNVGEIAVPVVDKASSAPLYESFPQGAAAVWERLLEATSSGGTCLNPPCGKVRSVRVYFCCCCCCCFFKLVQDFSRCCCCCCRRCF